MSVVPSESVDGFAEKPKGRKPALISFRSAARRDDAAAESIGDARDAGSAAVPLLSRATMLQRDARATTREKTDSTRK
jgi:hypothetical protein